MRRGTVLVALVALLGLSSCSDDGSPTPPISVTSVSPTTAAATTPPVAPTVPAAEPTAKSAEAFVRYFWAAFNYSNLVLDPKPLAAISGPDCLFCRSATDVIDDLTQSHKHVTGGLVTVDTVVVPPGDLKAGAVITTVVSQSPGQTLEGSMKTSDTPGIRHMRSEIALDWSQEGWQVRDVANDEKSGSKW